MTGWFDSGPTWPLEPSEVAQSSHPCLTPCNSLRFIPFPFLSFLISMCRPEKRPSLESCHDSSAQELGLHEFMPKNPNSEFELLKCNKAPFSCSPHPPPPNRWQMWSFLVMWAFSCWAGKIEASAHFLENQVFSKLFFLTSSLNSNYERQRGGGGERFASVNMKRPYQLHITGQSQKLLFSFFLWGLSVGFFCLYFFHLSHNAACFSDGPPICLDWTGEWWEGML